MKSQWVLSTLLVFILLATANGAAAATLYKWMDENGAVHYGEKPPEGVEATAVSVPDGAAPSGTAPMFSPRPKSSQKAEAERQKLTEQLKQEQVSAELMEQACAKVQQQLDILVPRTNVLVQDNNGQTRRMDDNERLEQIEIAEKFMQQNCK